MMGVLQQTDVFAIRNVHEGGEGTRVGRWAFYWCPCCNDIHGLPLDYPNSRGAQWSWDGNLDAPTLAPSVLRRVELGHNAQRVCHHHIQQGKLSYCNDTTPNQSGEGFAGRIVELPELPHYWRRLRETI